MPIDRSTKFYLLRGHSVAAPIPVSSPSRQGWIAVFNLQPIDSMIVDVLEAAELTLARVRAFEIEVEQLDRGWEIAEEQLLDKREFTAQSFAELEALVASLGIDPAELRLSADTDCPI
jgi:hypothetical protein